MAAKKTSKKATPPAKNGSKVSGKKSGIAAELAALDADWDSAEEKAGGGDVPDGKYAVRIEEAMIGKSKASDRLQVNWTLKIVAGEHAGRNLWKHDGITDTEGLSWLRTALTRLGVEWPASSGELPETLEGLVGTFAEVQAKTKAGNDIQNVYFNKALDSADIEASDDDGVVEEEEETEEDEGEDEGEEATIEKGSRVTAEIEGDEYAGKVVKISGDTATVLFDDGEKLELDISELTLEESESEEEADDEEADDEEEETEEEEAEDDEEAEDEEEEEGDDPKVTVPAKAKITPADKKATAAAAKKHGFDLDEYESPQDCVIDMAEYVGVTGNFKDWATLIAKIAVAKVKK